MTMTSEQKMIYDLVLESHFADVQILKNQKHLLQLKSNTENIPIHRPSEELIEETDNILRLIQHE